jgi:hypothetical protein
MLLQLQLVLFAFGRFYIPLPQNDSECTELVGQPIANQYFRGVVRLREPKNYTEKLIKLMQGKLRGDLGSALPFLPGLFINYKLLRATFCYIAHLIWRLNMPPLITSCIHPQTVSGMPGRQLDVLATRPGLWLDASIHLLHCCKF